jgi:hypothetical protein
MFPRSSEARPLANGWASRTSAAVAQVDKFLEKAGLDREAIFAQILADKLDVIERIDLMIFRAEQRRNAALHEIEQYRNGTADRMRQLQSQFEEGMPIRPLPRGAHSDPDRPSFKSPKRTAKYGPQVRSRQGEGREERFAARARHSRPTRFGAEPGD